MSWLTRVADALTPPSSKLPDALPQAYGGEFWNLTDPGLGEFLSGGASAVSGSGMLVNDKTALRNTSVLRCVTLISNAIGRLPLHLLDSQAAADDKKAVDHPLFKVLHRKPNSFQTAFEFRRLMQRRVLVDGNAYALPIRGPRGNIVALIPIAPGRVRVEQNADWSLTYHVAGGTAGGDGVSGSGSVRQYDGKDMFHLRGMSSCGLLGDSLVKQANESIGLALGAERAAGRLFKNGSLTMSTLELPAGMKLSPEAMKRLKAQIDEQRAGVENAGGTMLLEEGLKLAQQATSARDLQHIETRKHQIEEIARVFGVPRPFLMIDDTSWGTGIEQLGIYLVQHCLAPHFEMWEQAIWRSLLTDQEQDRYQAKFNEAALLRGSMQNQADYLRKLVGTGQDPQLIEVNEAREFLDLGEHKDGEGLAPGLAKAGETVIPAPPAADTSATTGVEP